ncbi:hypothetical protein SteCoe_23251 [Stentor coeruleus]|uniref:Atg6 BARA domain-containing protein n=1 Tax=Stentor coeruleus TaxID=5963 RepID=A0A1R2BKC3_9CILI|nr:hypothetical protein SteCoe_23251 [Stentor coeruleus]
MEINSCLVCSEALNNENTEQNVESENMEVSFYEDMKKTQILNNICLTNEGAILCKACKHELIQKYSEKILVLETTNKNLTQSLEDIKDQLGFINTNKHKNPNFLYESLKACDDTEKSLQEQIKNLEISLEEADKNIEKLDQEDLIIQAKMLETLDPYLESNTRKHVIEEEIKYLTNEDIMLKIFVIDSQDKIGTINGLRLGRLDHILVHWDEINAAWGFCALLLLGLYQKNNLKSSKISLYPLGSASRISYMKIDKERFELFFSDYDYTGKIKRFNKAQCMFLELLKEYEDIIQDKGVPYNIVLGSIGGISIEFNPTQKTSWTNALRFMLQNLNYFLNKL